MWITCRYDGGKPILNPPFSMWTQQRDMKTLAAIKVIDLINKFSITSSHKENEYFVKRFAKLGYEFAVTDPEVAQARFRDQVEHFERVTNETGQTFELVPPHIQSTCEAQAKCLERYTFENGLLPRHIVSFSAGDKASRGIDPAGYNTLRSGWKSDYVALPVIPETYPDQPLLLV